MLWCERAYSRLSWEADPTVLHRRSPPPASGFGVSVSTCTTRSTQHTYAPHTRTHHARTHRARAHAPRTHARTTHARTHAHTPHTRRHARTPTSRRTHARTHTRQPPRHGLLEWHCTWTGRPTHASHTHACTRAHRTHAHAHANHRATHTAPPAYLLCAVHGWEVFRNCDGGEWGQKPRFGGPRAAAIAPQSPNPLARGPALTTGLPRPLHVAVPNGPTICPLTTRKHWSPLLPPLG